MEWKTIFTNVIVTKEMTNKMVDEYNRFRKLINTDDLEADKEAKEAFVGSANDIAAIRNRPFTKLEQSRIIYKWSDVVKRLKQLYDSNFQGISEEDMCKKYKDFEEYIIYEVCGVKKEKKSGQRQDSRPRAATLKLAASVLPEYLSSIANEGDMNELFDYLGKNKLIDIEIKELKNKTAFEKSHILLKKIKEEYERFNNSGKDYYCFPWEILEYFRAKDLVEIETLLLNNKNIIFTGAPGTGKTYLAKKIASHIITGNKEFEHLVNEEKAMFESQYKFVQFHPSYDYTDFVEGLRPQQDDVTKEVKFQRMDGIFKAFCVNAAIAEDEDAKQVTEKKIKEEDKRKFVFVIDEINRGEISKIFGELFFSIDPGYRGKEKGLIDTQYQNLIKDEEKMEDGNTPYPFDKGFYVPTNVYVIGTMNDIDRSVESMDFAFRRRFAFKEITAAETQESIFSSLDPSLQTIATNKMNALNNAIYSEGYGSNCNILEGFSAAYHIGAAYFKKIENYKGDNMWKNLWDYHIKGVLSEYLRGIPNAQKLLTQLEDIYNKA